MDGLGRAIGAGATFRLNGKVYQIAPVSVAIKGAVEQHILLSRKNPLRAVAEQLGDADLSEEHEKYLLELAYEDIKKQNKVSSSEYRDFAQSIEGLVFIIWHMIREKHPEVTYEEVQRHANENVADFMLRATWAIDQLGGTDHLGKLIGLMATSGDPALEKAAKELSGELSFGPSSIDTKDGPLPTSVS